MTKFEAFVDIHPPLQLVGVLRNQNGEVLYMFFKQVGVEDSNGADILAILEALRIYQCSFQLSLKSGEQLYQCRILCKNIQRALEDAILF